MQSSQKPKVPQKRLKKAIGALSETPIISPSIVETPIAPETAPIVSPVIAETAPETTAVIAPIIAETETAAKVKKTSQRKPRTQKYQQSKTIIRRLSNQANVKSLATDCYPIILDIIEELVEIIIGKLRDKLEKRKTIATPDIEDVITNTNEPFNPLFTRTAFKRQIKRCLVEKASLSPRISPTALKLIQRQVETIMTNVLSVSQSVSENANRKRVFKKDIELAWQMIKKT